MPTQYEKALLAQGVTQEFIDAERAKGKRGLLKGVNVDPQDVEPILSAFRASGNPYSAGNIASVAAGGVPAPDYNDPLGYRARLENELGINEAQQKYNEAINALRAFDQGSLGQQNFLEGQTIPLGVIRGEQAEAARQRSLERQTLADAAAVQQDYLLAKRAELENRLNDYNRNRDQMVQIINNNPGAGIKLTDTLEQVSAKIAKYAEKQAKEAEKEKLKDLALAAGIDTKGLSASAIRKKLAKKAKKDSELKARLDELDIKKKEADIQNVYSEIANRGLKDQEKEDAELIKQFENDVQRLQAAMDKENSGIDWDYAWHYIDRYYPGFTPQEIDEALGLNYRKKFENR